MLRCCKPSQENCVCDDPPVRPSRVQGHFSRHTHIRAERRAQAQAICFGTLVINATVKDVVSAALARVRLLSCGAEQFVSRIGSLGWHVIESPCFCRASKLLQAPWTPMV